MVTFLQIGWREFIRREANRLASKTAFIITLVPVESNKEKKAGRTD
jgi:hypothetical protein